MTGPDPDNPPWSLLEALLTWAASMLLSLLVPWLLAFPYVVSHYPGGHLTNQQLYDDKTLVIILISALLPVHAITFVIAWFVTSRFRKVSVTKALGWGWKANFGIGKSVGLALLLYLVTRVVIFKFGGPETELERILQSSRAAALLTAFVAAVTAPLVEEVLYRGLLYSAFQRVIGVLPAVIVVAAMFAGLHVLQYWPNAGAISAITLLSLVLTTVRARTGRLLPCYVIHLVFNGIQSLLILISLLVGLHL